MSFQNNYIYTWKFFDEKCRQLGITSFITYHMDELYKFYKLINTDNVIPVRADQIDSGNNIYAEYSTMRYAWQNNLCKTPYICFGTYRRHIDISALPDAINENDIWLADTQYIKNPYELWKNDDDTAWTKCLYINDFQQWLEKINYDYNFKTIDKMYWKEMFICHIRYFDEFIKETEYLINGYLEYSGLTYEQSGEVFDRWFIENLVSLVLYTVIKRNRLIEHPCRHIMYMTKKCVIPRHKQY